MMTEDTGLTVNLVIAQLRLINFWIWLSSDEVTLYERLPLSINYSC